MGYTLKDDYFRVDVDDRSSLYFRVSGGVRQVVATGEEAKDALIQVWGQPHRPGRERLPALGAWLTPLPSFYDLVIE